jgi:hypothetical protein
LKRNKVFDQKVVLENQFIAWVSSDEGRKKQYGGILDSIKEAYALQRELVSPYYHLNIAGFGGAAIIELALEFLSFNSPYYQALKENAKSKDPLGKLKADLETTADKHFKDYDMETDRRIFAELLKLYRKNVSSDYLPAFFSTIDKKFKGNIDAYTHHVYKTSVLGSRESFAAFLQKPSSKKIDKDPAIAAMMDFVQLYFKLSGDFDAAEEKLVQSYRIYIKGLMEMNSAKSWYPDANSTMRMTYGTVSDYYPADAVYFNYFTTLEGIFEKEDPSNEEFVVPAALKELFVSKNYGRYADKNGKMNVCFITNNDITGGNSGSPVLNAKGELIGCAFDGNWEAMSGDVNYEPKVQRTISVDIRYILFIIDKMAGAHNLINEMTIVE